jgi:hypothetical protein
MEKRRHDDLEENSLQVRFALLEQVVKNQSKDIEKLQRDNLYMKEMASKYGWICVGIAVGFGLLTKMGHELWEKFFIFVRE